MITLIVIETGAEVHFHEQIASDTVWELGRMLHAVRRVMNGC